MLMEYYRPRTIEEAVQMKGTDSLYIAGGTDLGVMLAEVSEDPSALIDLCGINGLAGIKILKDGLFIGPCTAIADIAAAKTAGPAETKLPDALVQGAAAIGSPQIRNMATIGGNICNASPCGDTLSPLAVLGAVFTVQGPEGLRRLSTGDFFRGPKQTALKPSEILTGIIIPSEYLDSGVSGFRMTGKRNGQAISQVNMAVRLVISEGIIKDAAAAAGSVAPVPLRLSRCEKLLKGSAANSFSAESGGSALLKELIQTAEEEVLPISDVRAGENYRRSVSGSLLADIVTELISGGEHNGD